ncbi:MAG: glycosyl transferase [Chitinophagales bacterium]|nr:MAG: glycosyl transferase [Chitinophagales bacterium]
MHTFENTIIVPAYNEEKRILNFVPHLFRFIQTHLPATEVIIVNNGSTDNTEHVVRQAIKEHGAEPFTQLIRCHKNEGKGNAVRAGVKAAKGSKKIIFVDADGAIAPEEIPAMLKKLEEFDFVAGDRFSHLAIVKTTILRKFFSRGINLLISIIFQHDYCDSLCGFKGFTRKTAEVLFDDLIEKQWIFDVELLFKARRKNFSVAFLPIKWNLVEDSHIRLWKDPFIWMLKLIVLRVRLINYH